MVSWFINELLYITIVISSYIQKTFKNPRFLELFITHNLTDLAIVNGGPTQSWTTIPQATLRHAWKVNIVAVKLFPSLNHMALEGRMGRDGMATR